MYINRFFLGIAFLLIVVASISASSAQQGGNTGTGRTGTGNTGGGSSGSGGYVQDFSLDSTSSITSNNSGFVGSTGNNSFIGSSTTGTTGRTQTTRNTTATRSNATRANTANRAGGQGGTSINTQRQVQPVYTLGFVPPTPNYDIVSSDLSQRMGYTVQTGRLASMQTELADGIAVVSGSVASEYDKKVMENMIRLHPGVSRIQSDIQIDPTTADQNPLSPSVRRNRQSAETPGVTTTQDQPLVYVFESSRNQQRVEIPVTTTPQGRPLVHVF